MRAFSGERRRETEREQALPRCQAGSGKKRAAIVLELAGTARRAQCDAMQRGDSRSD